MEKGNSLEENGADLADQLTFIQVRSTDGVGASAPKPRAVKTVKQRSDPIKGRMDRIKAEAEAAAKKTKADVMRAQKAAAAAEKRRGGRRARGCGQDAAVCADA